MLHRSFASLPTQDIGKEKNRAKDCTDQNNVNDQTECQSSRFHHSIVYPINHSIITLATKLPSHANLTSPAFPLDIIQSIHFSVSLCMTSVAFSINPVRPVVPAFFAKNSR